MCCVVPAPAPALLHTVIKPAKPSPIPLLSTLASYSTRHFLPRQPHPTFANNTFPQSINQPPHASVPSPISPTNHHHSRQYV